ncbi:MAG: hypothetical protein CVV41_13460 [Candidatus Riflebacteria bacterium HGW-Riflebacteria-1]|jgi:hypothetical protein|nr:MAG: hypothetical protein CVV41_13460 [Candidatus Riflebacteria bacterium HGW-Riflebacteria-1]
MNLNRKGGIMHLILATLLSLSVVAIAVLLSSVRTSTIVPAIALINADYQVESAIIMQLKKAHFSPTLPEQTLEKEIMPGVVLKLKGVAVGNGNWQFNGSITGNELNQTFAAHANMDNPDQIRFSSYSLQE